MTLDTIITIALGAASLLTSTTVLNIFRFGFTEYMILFCKAGKVRAGEFYRYFIFLVLWTLFFGSAFAASFFIDFNQYLKP